MKQYLMYKNKRIFLDVEGNKCNSSNLLLCLHGLGGSKKMFQYFFLDPVLKNETILTVDLPGHGQSSKSSFLSFSIEESIEILQILLKRYNYKKLYVIGHSLGATIGLLLGQKITVDYLVSIDGVFTNTDTGERMTFAEFKIMLAKSTVSSEIITDLNLCSSRAFLQMAASLNEVTKNKPVLKLLKAMKAKKKHIYGNYIPNELFATFEKNQITKITRANHFLIHDNPSDVISAIRPILQP